QSFASRTGCSQAVRRGPEVRGAVLGKSRRRARRRSEDLSGRQRSVADRGRIVAKWAEVERLPESSQVRRSWERRREQSRPRLVTPGDTTKGLQPCPEPL